MNPTNTTESQVEPVQQIGCGDCICSIVNSLCLALCCGCDEDKE